MIGTPIQIAGLSGQALQGVVMKQEPGETGSSQGLTITPVSLASHSQHVSVLQMSEVSGMMLGRHQTELLTFDSFKLFKHSPSPLSSLRIWMNRKLSGVLRDCDHDGKTDT